jgi:hypothetical protein
MPVKKYRSIEETPSERWLEPGDPAIGRRLQFVSSVVFALAGSRRIPPGVRKYRSYDDLLDDRETFDDARIARIQAERSKDHAKN